VSNGSSTKRPYSRGIHDDNCLGKYVGGVAFGLVVGERNGQVEREPQDVVAVFVEPVE